MCLIDGCEQQTLTGDYCYFHTKVRDGLITLEETDVKVTDEHRRLFQKYQFIAIGTAYRAMSMVNTGVNWLTLHDLMQQTYLMLWQLIVTNSLTDVTYPVAYLQQACLYQLISVIRQENYLQFVPLSMQQETPETDAGIVSTIHEDRVIKKVLRFVKRCSKLEKEIFHYHVYPTTYKPRSLRWLSKKLDIPLTTLYRVKKKLLRKFRRGVR